MEKGGGGPRENIRSKTLLDLAVDKNLSANAGDTGSIPGSGGSHLPWKAKPMHHTY